MFDHRRYDSPLHRRLDDSQHIFSVQLISRQLCVVGNDLQLWHDLLLFNKRRLQPINSRDRVSQLVPFSNERIQIVTVQLHRDLSRHAGEHVADQMSDRLLGLVLNARNVLRQFRDAFQTCFTPNLSIFNRRDRVLGCVDSHDVFVVLRAAGFCGEEFDELFFAVFAFFARRIVYRFRVLLHQP